jgi:hypothetical protein
MGETLKSRYGFPGDGNMRILTDARATTKSILDGLAWLTAEASPGDTLIFHYSGHGSQVPDRNGDEATDRLDEILCPYDLDWDHPLTDYAIARNLHYPASRTRPVHPVHSGCTIPRGNFIRPRGIPPSDSPDRHRFLPHPETPHSATHRERRPVRRFGISVTRTNAVLIAACRNDQTSADAWIDGGYHGAHTHYLCQALRNGSRDVTYRALVSATGIALSRAGFDQVPQLEGPAKFLLRPFSAT